MPLGFALRGQNPIRRAESRVTARKNGAPGKTRTCDPQLRKLGKGPGKSRGYALDAAYGGIERHRTAPEASLRTQDVASRRRRTPLIALMPAHRSGGTDKDDSLLNTDSVIYVNYPPRGPSAGDGARNQREVDRRVGQESRGGRPIDRRGRAGRADAGLVRHCVGSGSPHPPRPFVGSRHSVTCDRNRVPDGPTKGRFHGRSSASSSEVVPRLSRRHQTIPRTPDPSSRSERAQQERPDAERHGASRLG